MATDKPRIVLQFNDFDFRHRKVLEILRARPRNMTDLVVNAILHFVSCPDAGQEFNKEALRQIVQEVILEMQEDGSLTLKTDRASKSTPALSDEDASDLGDFMSAFRK